LALNNAFPATGSPPVTAAGAAAEPAAGSAAAVVGVSCENEVIFAHTVLPAAPRGVLSRWFAGLGGRSLGSLLFAHPGFVRGPLAFARIDRRHPLYARAEAALGTSPRHFLARRCAHRFGGQRVVVTEVFSAGIASLRFATR